MIIYINKIVYLKPRNFGAEFVGEISVYNNYINLE